MKRFGSLIQVKKDRLHCYFRPNDSLLERRKLNRAGFF